MSNIKNLLHRTIKSKNNKQIKLIISPVRKSIVTKVKNATGLDVSGFNFVIDNFAIKHCIQKHGNPKTERLRGQEAVTFNTFE
jgi:uncharacterized alkaline shock family protein YloU